MRAFRTFGVACALLLPLACVSHATTRYVDVASPTPDAPYTNWASASRSIQSAINAAISGDEILVAPGVYLLTGSAVLIPNEKTLTLRSTQSRAAIIDAQGQSDGLRINGSNCLVEGMTVRNGTNASYGGGVFIASSSTLRDCLVTGNYAASGGGGIEIYGAATVENCTISSNVVQDIGGGVLFYAGTTGLMHHCMISDNLVAGHTGAGGGVYIQGGGTVSNCWIQGNTVTATNGDGGGVHMYTQGTGQTGTLVNVVIHGNTAGRDGGGVYSDGPAGTLQPMVNCTVVANTAGRDGGGVFAHTTRLINDIIYFNSALTNANLNAHDSVHSCIISNCCTTTDYGWPSLTNAPAFVNLASGDFHLATASFCIDAGTTNGAPRTDIEGNPRPRVGKPGGVSQTDIGAYEYGFHFKDIRFTSTNAVQFLWDVQDRGIYKLDALTNNATATNWVKDIAVFTNSAMASGQFAVHTQTLAILPPVPATAIFRLRVSHTIF